MDYDPVDGDKRKAVITRNYNHYPLGAVSCSSKVQIQKSMQRLYDGNYRISTEGITATSQWKRNPALLDKEDNEATYPPSILLLIVPLPLLLLPTFLNEDNLPPAQLSLPIADNVNTTMVSPQSAGRCPPVCA